MIGFTNGEVRAYLTGHPELRCEVRNLWFANPEAPSITVNLRVKGPHQLVYLARLAAHLGHDEGHFGHACLWITTWGVWSNHDEAIAFKTLERFRRSYGEARSIEAAPGTCFRHDEFIESVSCLLQPMLIGWDAYYVPSWAPGGIDYFVSVSHDGFIDIEVRTKALHAEVVGIFRRHIWIDGLMKS